jgi:hypothetical protein
MKNSDTQNAIRELSSDELSSVAGAAINVDIDFCGLKLMFRGGDYFEYLSIADSQNYTVSGLTTSGAQLSGSGPVPQ